VQGVGFRWFAEREAGPCRVSGFARNLADGRVEVLAQGDAKDVGAFEALVKQGPRHAHVEGFQTEEVPVDPDLVGFNIRF